MNFTELSCRDFTYQVSAKTPVPGGGGAGALAAAIGTALGAMVGNYTLGKKKYASVEEKIRDLVSQALIIRNQLLDLVEADAEAFSALNAAYAVPKETPDRELNVQDKLREAAEVPFRIMELACRAIELQVEFAEKGSKMMISDAGAGAALCQGAMNAAALNVKVNTKLMTDRNYAEKLNTDTDNLLNKYKLIAEKLYNSVYAGLS